MYVERVVWGGINLVWRVKEKGIVVEGLGFG